METLQRDEQLIVQLCNAQPDAVIWYKPVLRFDEVAEVEVVADFEAHYCNEAAGTFLHSTREVVIGQRVLQTGLIDEGYKRNLFDQLLEVWKGGGQTHNTVFNAHLGRYYDTVRTPVAGGVLSVMRDRTRQYLQDREQRRQGELLNTIIHSSPTCIVLCEAIREDGAVTDFRVLLVNEKISHDLGRPRTEIEGQTYCTLHPSIRTNGYLSILQDVAISGKPFKGEINVPAFGGWIYLTVNRVDRDKLVIICADLSEAKRLQGELEGTVMNLQRANNSLDEFVHAASHDMREPLRKMEFFADRLKSVPAGSPEAGALFQRMDGALRRMNSVLDDLLNYARAGVLPPAAAPVDLQEVIRALLIEEERTITATGAIIYCEDLPQVTGYRSQLLQLFRILLSNAFTYRHSERTPQIRISARTRNDEGGSWCVITVSDNGIGFDPQERERIFQVFQRLHGNSEAPGTGIGLAIARRIAENHRGSISADSRPGAGAEFSLQLPL